MLCLLTSLLQRFCPTFTRVGGLLWHSNTATAWFNTLASPLRLLVLTPLVVRLPELEIGVFGLLSTGVILLSVFSTSLQMVFTTMLSYAYGGATDLSPIARGEMRDATGGPNWPLFSQALQTLFYLQIFAALPLLLIGALSISYGVGNLTEWDFGRWDLWLTLLVFIASQTMLMLTSRHQAALSAAGKIALINRASSGFVFLSIFLGAGVLAATQSLPALITTQAVVAYFRMSVIRKLANDRIPEVRKSSDSHSLVFCRSVARASWHPLWRSTLGILTGRGVRAISAVYITNLSGIWGLSTVVSFNFSLQLLQTLLSISIVPITTNGPLFASLLAQGKAAELRKKSGWAILMSVAVYALGAVSVGVIGPLILERFGSNVQLLPSDQWWLFSLLFGGHVVIACFASVCNLDNRARFFWRNIVSAVIVISIFMLMGGGITVEQVIFSITIPYFVVIEFSPLRGYIEMSRVGRDN